MEKEKELVDLLKKDSIKAFDQLFFKYSPRIYSFAFSFLKNQQDSEEVVQETFLRIWKNRKKIDRHYSFRSFLFTIGYNLVMDQFRKKVKDFEFLDVLKSELTLKDTTTEKEIDFKSARRRYNQLLEQLPDRRKVIYKLARFEGYTYKEIADYLKISVNTVENQMTAAIRYLRKNLSQESFVALLFCYLLV